MRNGHYHEDGLFEHWLMTIAKHRLESFYRRKKIARLFSAIGDLDFPDASAADEYKDFLKRLGYTLKHSMSTQYRLIVILHFFKKRTFREIDARLGAGKNTASSECSKAIAIIREAFGVHKSAA